MEANAFDSTVTWAQEQQLAFPPPPAPVQPTPFPLVACLAPLAASGLIWAITHSPFALVFAALSPVIALAGVVDGRWHARRARRAAQRQRDTELDALQTELERRSRSELAERRRRTPSALTVMRRGSRIARWTTQSDRFALITLGTGSVASGVRPAGAAASDRESELQRRFSCIDDAPLEADATLSIGVVGSPMLTRAVARGYLVQLMHAFAPGPVALRCVPSRGWEWARSLPQYRPEADGALCTVAIMAADVAETDGLVAERRASAASSATDVHQPAARSAVIAVAPSLEELPLPCRIVLAIDAPGSARVLASPNRQQIAPIVPELVSEEQAEGFSRELAEHAAAVGLAAARTELPEGLAFRELDNERPGGSDGASALTAAIGTTQQGQLVIDLVSDGPHAIVGGTTGSGKSELLVTWVTALANQYSPQQLGFLLVDFKGGSAFAPLTTLPHCVGLITDLGHGEAERALRSLTAELRHREQTLADLGVRDVAEAAGTLSRLVIVVDEFAAMLDAFPDFHALFVDIAARGRSLGVHTILCTQRPAGVVRDSLMANCALRICLRVHDALDSTALVATDAAARLSAARPGRCIVLRDGATVPAQIASTALADIDQVARSTLERGNAVPPRRPWLDPLPAQLLLESLGQVPAGACLLGLEDVPEEQRHGTVSVRLSESHLVVLGVRGSGKTTAVRSLAQQFTGAVRFVSGQDAESLWDVLNWACQLCDGALPSEPRHSEETSVGTVGGTLLLFDDLDALLARMPDEYQDAAVQNLARVLREGPAVGLAVVATMQRVTSMLRGSAALFGETLLLKQMDRQEHVLAGGDPALYDDRIRPGAGSWRGHRMQVAMASSGALRSSSPTASADRRRAESEPDAMRVVEIGAAGSGCTILVSRNPGARARSLRSAHEPARCIVVDISASAASADAAASELEITSGALTSSAVVVVGDPEAWQSRWQLLSSLRSRSTIVFDGCSVADVRMLLRTRVLPPLCVGAGRVWAASSASEPLHRAQLLIGASADHTAARSRLGDTP